MQNNWPKTSKRNFTYLLINCFGTSSAIKSWRAERSIRKTSIFWHILLKFDVLYKQYSLYIFYIFDALTTYIFNIAGH